MSIRPLTREVPHAAHLHLDLLHASSTWVVYGAYLSFSNYFMGSSQRRDMSWINECAVRYGVLAVHYVWHGFISYQERFCIPQSIRFDRKFGLHHKAVFYLQYKTLQISCQKTWLTYRYYIFLYFSKWRGFYSVAGIVARSLRELPEESISWQGIKSAQRWMHMIWTKGIRSMNLGVSFVLQHLAGRPLHFLSVLLSQTRYICTVSILV